MCACACVGEGVGVVARVWVFVGVCQECWLPEVAGIESAM